MRFTKRQLLAMGSAAVVGLGVVGVGTAVAQDNDDELTTILDEILGDSRLDGSQAGLVVSEADSGEVIYDHNGDTRSLPASVTKMLTSSAAMNVLGPDFQFSTDVLAAGKAGGGTIAGDLYLRGSGDPTMLAEDYDALAADLAADGVTKVDGDLVADDTAYDNSRLGLEWSWDDEPYYYAAPISALTVAADEDYDAGSVTVTVAPGEAGEAPKVAFGAGGDYFTVKNTAETVAGDESDITVERSHGSETIKISGEIGADADSVTEWSTVNNPTGHAAAVFAAALADNGITVSGDTRLGEAAPEDAESLAARDSMPLEELLVPFMKLSNNSHAESLVKAMGREAGDEGSWDAGLSVVSDFLAKNGMDPDTFAQADGSGLSRRNEIPVTQINTLAQQLRDQDWFSTWYDALPVACQEDRLDGGTLRQRMCDTPAAGNLHAKTGSMSAVSALSGYVQDADERDLVFTVVLNDLVAESVTDIEDEIAVALASFSQDDPSAAESRGDIPQPESTTPNGMECSWVKPITC